MLNFLNSVVAFFQDSLNYIRPLNLVKASKFYVYSFIFLSKHRALFPVVAGARIQAVDLISNGTVNADALVAAPHLFKSFPSSHAPNFTSLEILSGRNPYLKPI